MRIALFNWRDIKNPLAGGAEAYQHRLLKEVRGRGHDATVFTSSFPGSAPEETIDGIRYVRYAGRFAIYPSSIWCYKKHVEGRYDIIIDTMNGVPFFTRLFAKEPVVLLVYQMTGANWHSAMPFPLAEIGMRLEGPMARIYSGCPVLALSDSTAKDLQSIGLYRPVILGGAGDVPAQGAQPEKEDAIIILGRLARSKRVEHALSAFKAINQAHPGYVLHVVGSGSEERRLKCMAVKLGIKDSVEFFGKVDEERKAELLSKARLMLFPAVREGWGMCVTESCMCGTPVIGYDVPGTRDSIEEGVNGFLIPEGREDLMAKKALDLIDDPDALGKMSESARIHSKGLDWGSVADRFLACLEKVA